MKQPKGKPAANQPKNLLPVHPDFVDSGGCSLTTKQKVRECIYPAMEARYNYRPVQDNTKLREDIGLDDQMIKTDLFATIIIAVETAGCKLRKFSPEILVQCKTAGDVTDAVWADLRAP